MKYHLTLKSSNKKTGPIPVSTTSSDSCPDICAFKGAGCYAESGPLLLHWRKVGNERGSSLDAFTDKIKALPEGQLWRHNQAGDLPGVNGKIDARALTKLVVANQGKCGFTYTHKPPTKRNLKLIRKANDAGFTINLSGNNINHAIELTKHNLPVATVIPIDSPKYQVINGHKIVTCPAAYRDTDCATCKLCQVRDRSYIIGFPAHGTSKKKANLIAMSN